MIRRLFLAVACTGLLALPALAQPQPSPDGFVPASSLPPGEQLPAAAFLIASYAVFLLLMLMFLWTIWRRIGRVEKDMGALERRQGGAKG